MELETTEPDFTTEDAKELGVKERISSYSTPVPYDPQRTRNLVQGAKNLNGMLIKPGETFSLIEALGPIDAAHGRTSTACSSSRGRPSPSLRRSARSTPPTGT